MILVVSLNPALDVTHHVAGVDWSGVNRPRRVATAPGGKGLNVARTLHALDSDVRVIGLAGGVTGEAVRAGLAAAGVPARAAAAGVPVVLDAEGPALRHGAAGGPAIAKPNLAELAAAVGRPLAGLGAAAAAAAELRDAGAAAVVVSLGGDGLLAVT